MNPRHARSIECPILPVPALIVVKHQVTKNGNHDHEAAQYDGKEGIRLLSPVGPLLHVVLQLET